MTERDQEVLQTVSANVRRLREAAGLSMSALARLIDDYPGTIERVEAGKNMPGVGLLMRIAEGLGVTLNDMVQPVPSPRKKIGSRLLTGAS